MNATLARRAQGAGTRRPIKRGTKRPAVEPSTLGASPSLAPFRSLLERFMRASGSDIHHRRTEVVAFIRRSRYRSLCVNELIHECVDRGGTDGLVTAIEVLAQIDPKVVLSVAWDFFRRDIGRWRQLAKGSHTRYVVRDEVWHILLRSICQSADPKDALALLLVALAGGPDGIREGCAEAAGDLVAREPKVMRVVTTCLRELLDSPPSGSQPLSPTSRDAIRDVLADMGE